MRKNEDDYYPCSFGKACNVLWAQEQGWSQTKTAIAFQLNVGTVNHIFKRKRFEFAVPVPPERPTIQ